LSGWRGLFFGTKTPITFHTVHQHNRSNPMTDETPNELTPQELEKKQRIDLLITLERMPKPSPAVDGVLSTLFSEFHLALMQRHPDMDLQSMLALPFTDNANLTFMLVEYTLAQQSNELTGPFAGHWALFQHGYLSGRYQNGLRSACITSSLSSAPPHKNAHPPTGLHWYGFGRFPQTALLAALMRYIIWPNANDAEYIDYSKPAYQPT
jgi:hypothetical protein